MLRKSMEVVEGKKSGLIPSEITLMLERPGAMQMSEWVVRVPIYVPRTASPDVPPLLVLQFDLKPPYPISKAPEITVVTAAAFISDEAKRFLGRCYLFLFNMGEI